MSLPGLLLSLFGGSAHIESIHNALNLPEMTPQELQINAAEEMKKHGGAYEINGGDYVVDGGDYSVKGGDYSVSGGDYTIKGGNQIRMKYKDLKN